MFFSTYLLLALPLVSAAPLAVKRQTSPAPTVDATTLVLRFADVLEQLESQFYAEALLKFKESDFQKAGFISSQIPIQQFVGIQKDESTHSSVIQDAIKANGAKPITDCKFDFSSALTDVATMAQTARVIENVGVGAYLGAAPLITDPVILVAAASILTVESRHQSILNLLGGNTAIPNSFDIALTPSEVLAVAGPFVSGCDVGIKPNPVLTITNSDPPKAGTKLEFKSDAIKDTKGLFCQMMIGGASFSIALPIENCIVPKGINGPVAIWITSDAQPLLNNVRDRATSQLVAGPTMVFVDSISDMLGSMIRMGSNKVSSGSGSASGATTITISPAKASDIIKSASASSSSTTPPPKATSTSSSSSASATSTGSSSSSSSSASSTSSASSSASATSTSSAASPTSTDSGSGDPLDPNGADISQTIDLNGSGDDSTPPSDDSNNNNNNNDNNNDNNNNNDNGSDISQTIDLNGSGGDSSSGSGSGGNNDNSNNTPPPSDDTSKNNGGDPNGADISETINFKRRASFRIRGSKYTRDANLWETSRRRQYSRELDHE